MRGEKGGLGNSGALVRMPDRTWSLIKKLLQFPLERKNSICKKRKKRNHRRASGPGLCFLYEYSTLSRRRRRRSKGLKDVHLLVHDGQVEISLLTYVPGRRYVGIFQLADAIWKQGRQQTVTLMSMMDLWYCSAAFILMGERRNKRNGQCQ